MEQPDALILTEALILTGIGIGTAFGVLVMLLVAVLVIGWVSGLLNRDEPEEAPVEEEGFEDTEAKNRATAAAIAVTALLESRPYLRGESSRNQDQ